jgi:VWFA-related protein
MMTRLFRAEAIRTAVCGVFTFGILALVVGVSVAGQIQNGGSVAVDFFAVNREGRPIPDLRDEQIALRVDGRPRRVESMEWVPPSDVPASPSPGQPLPAPFGTNAVDAGRAIVLVMDDDSFRPGREAPLREAANGFLAELPARDRIALATVPYGGLKADFTTDRRRITQALAQIVGQAPPNETGQDLACRTRLTLESLVGLLNSLSGGQGPTTVIFFSSAMAGPRRDAPVMLAPGVCELTPEHFRRVGTAAAAVRAHFYLMQPDEVKIPSVASTVENIAGAGFTGSDNPMEGLEHLAGVTGGQQIQLTGSRESGLRRIARETAGYYLIRFAPESSDRNNSVHAVEIKTTRDDVTIRARPNVFIAKSASRGPTVTPRTMLRDPKVYRDLPLRAIGYASNAEDKKVKVLTIVEPIDPSLKITGAAAALIDSKGTLVAQWTANNEELAASPLMTALVVDPGVYRLRMAATSEGGLGGTADYEVDAGLAPAGPLKVSDLVLGVSRGAFRPRLQFTTEAVALAYVELYGSPGATPPTVTVEVANSLDGPAVLTLPAAIAETSDPNRRIATAAIPVGSLPAGDYSVRAIVSIPGQPSGRVVRTLRKAR